MTASKLTVVALAGLLVVAGAVTAAAGGMPGSASDVEEAQGPRDVNAEATYDNGTVTVTVTANGSGVENVTVLADDERVGTTDANGTVAFETNASEELELELHKGGFEGELQFAIQDGSLVLLEEEYEYPEVETDDEDDENEAEEEDEAEDDEDDETEDGDEESEDEEADEDEDDEDEDDEQQESDDG